MEGHKVNGCHFEPCGCNKAITRSINFQKRQLAENISVFAAVSAEELATTICLVSDGQIIWEPRVKDLS